MKGCIEIENNLQWKNLCNKLTIEGSEAKQYQTKTQRQLS